MLKEKKVDSTSFRRIPLQMAEMMSGTRWKRACRSLVDASAVPLAVVCQITIRHQDAPDGIGRITQQRLRIR
jgi:hypothetical protein